MMGTLASVDDGNSGEFHYIDELWTVPSEGFEQKMIRIALLARYDASRPWPKIGSGEFLDGIGFERD